MEDKTALEKLNKFTRREHTQDEVYIFDLVLCDNEIDRDMERFSDNALKSLEKLFVGKTGIFDHNPKSSGQTARIFSTELVTDDTRKNQCGEPYRYLKACAYMVRTDANSDLIKEIDGGIKKEVSISCSSAKQVCSICGADRRTKSCAHIKGKSYNGKTAYVLLDGIKDAYEWSFVAVPAQVNAGVTKRFGANDESDTIKNLRNIHEEDSRIIGEICSHIKGEITRLCFIDGENICSKALADAAEKMDIIELMAFKEKLEKEHISKAKPQLLSKDEQKSLDSFKV